MRTKKQTDDRHMTTRVSAGLGSVAGVAVGTMAAEELVAAGQAGGDNYYADNNCSGNDLPDYVNDAGVSTVMA